jgi:hypothetical protein
MSTFRSGDRARVVSRAVTEEDRRKNRYFEHMAGLTGTIQQVYSDDEVALEVDPDSMSEVSADVQKVATQRMRDKFLDRATEEDKKTYTKEELNFDAHYVVLIRPADLEKL